MLLQISELQFVLGLFSVESMYQVCMYGHHLKQSMDQLNKVANPARGQEKQTSIFPLSPFAPEKLVSRDRFGRPVPRQPAHSPHSG